MKIIKLKNVITEIKHLIERIYQWFRDDRGRISEPEDKSQKNHRIFYLNNKEKIDYISIASETQDHNKRSNICAIKVLEAEEKGQRAEKCSKK